MDQPIEYAKLSGSGNDFICIDNRDGRHDAMLADPAAAGRFARVICRRGLSLGADGVIFACQPKPGEMADFSARHFEPDGSEAELCGNGVACFTRWTLDNKWVADNEVRIMSTAGVVVGKLIEGAYVRVCIPLPEKIATNFDLDVKGRSWRCDFAITGTPHVVTYVMDVNCLDLPHWGPGFRYHPRFAPRGANANFVQVLGEGELAVRTWEFGVEAETLACGTGSATAAILAARRFAWGERFTRGREPVAVRVRGGDILRVYFSQNARGDIEDLCLESVVRFIALGTLHPDMQREALR